jgi:hypothetical protein
LQESPTRACTKKAGDALKLHRKNSQTAKKDGTAKMVMPSGYPEYVSICRAVQSFLCDSKLAIGKNTGSAGKLISASFY